MESQEITEFREKVSDLLTILAKMKRLGLVFFVSFLGGLLGSYSGIVLIQVLSIL